MDVWRRDVGREEESGVLTPCVVWLEEKSGSEVWMTTASDLKSPLEYFFWASLSYEPLS